MSNFEQLNKEFTEKNRVLLRYARGQQNQKRGVVLAFKEGDEVKLGWSFCHKLDGAEQGFDKEFGIFKAWKRAKPINTIELDNSVPYDLRNILIDMAIRAGVYFKRENKFLAQDRLLHQKE